MMTTKFASCPSSNGKANDVNDIVEVNNRHFEYHILICTMQMSIYDL